MFEHLARTWDGTKELYLKPTDPPLVSTSVIALTPLAEQMFIQMNYAWSYDEKEREGFLIIRANVEKGTATAAWGDSFHQSGSIMFLEGDVNERGIINVLGSYSAPPGPDWGWRIVVDVSEMELLQVTMYNIWPEGQEDIAVLARYAPVW